MYVCTIENTYSTDSLTVSTSIISSTNLFITETASIVAATGVFILIGVVVITILFQKRKILCTNLKHKGIR